MFHIYLYEGEKIHGADGETLVREAASAYCREHNVGIEKSNSFEILREAKGKPYFPNLPIKFNISHSGQMWICIMGETPCGIDIQEVKECSFKKIAAKYFSRQEQSYVFKYGLDGFFQIWTRREAFGKYTGGGFYDEHMPSFVDEQGQLKPYIKRQDNTVYLRELDMGPNIKCAYCNQEEQDEVYIFG